MKNKLDEMLKDEKKAPVDYHKLLKETKGKKNKKVILGIIKQERQHYRKLQKIKKKLK